MSAWNFAAVDVDKAFVFVVALGRRHNTSLPNRMEQSVVEGDANHQFADGELVLLVALFLSVLSDFVERCSAKSAVEPRVPVAYKIALATAVGSLHFVDFTHFQPLAIPTVRRSVHAHKNVTNLKLITSHFCYPSAIRRDQIHDKTQPNQTNSLRPAAANYYTS